MASKLDEIQAKVDKIVKEIGTLHYDFTNEDNHEDYRDELENAVVALDDALEVIQREIALVEYLRQSGLVA